tara:strand:- start:1478 stop:1591 length:114 start_codon:yes stop_codon:yes gene_type:complete
MDADKQGFLSVGFGRGSYCLGEERAIVMLEVGNWLIV